MEKNQSPQEPKRARGRPRRYPSSVSPSIRLSDMNKKLLRGFRKYFSGYHSPKSANFWPQFLEKEKRPVAGRTSYSLSYVESLYNEPRFRSAYRRWLVNVFLKDSQDKVLNWYIDYLLREKLT